MAVSDLIGKVADRRPGLLGNRSKGVAPVFGDEVLDEHSGIFACRKDLVKRDLCAASIPLGNDGRLNATMNDKRQCRKQWLRLFKQREGTIAALAAKIGTDPNYLSSLLGPGSKRAPGDDIARKMEKAYNLPPGTTYHPSAKVRELIRASDGMDDAALEKALEYIQFLKSSKN